MSHLAPHLDVSGVGKRFGRFAALSEVDFAAGRGEFVCILGPSGCGKTTLLRVVAGLERQDAGSVRLAGREVSGLPVSRRGMGVVFQSYALFPNLSAADNVGYGLRGRLAPGPARARVAEMLELVGLPEAARKYPAQLSGGQQQRVALARALAHTPELLLLDEPLSALDAKVRERLRAEVRAVQQRLGVTTIMVTHDQEEALTMADRILVMDAGRIVQDGAPQAVYERPATPFVAAFLGAMNFIPGAVKVGRDLYRAGEVQFAVDDCGDIPHGRAATLAIRPEDVMVTANGQALPNALAGALGRAEYRGPVYRLTLSLAAGRLSLEAEMSAEKYRRLGLCESMPVRVGLPPDRLRAYAA